jgi:fucose permease
LAIGDISQALVEYRLIYYAKDFAENLLQLKMMHSPFNLARISLSSFLAYFIMAAIITPLGVVSTPIAEYFSVSVTAATAAFSSLTTGILIGAILAIFVFDYARIRTVVIAAAGLIGVGLSATYLFPNFLLFNASLFIIGVGCGVSMSTASVVITKAFSEKMRPSMLLLTDSFYSGAATISSLLAVSLIAMNWHWWSTYLLALSATALLILLAAFSDYPARQGLDAERAENTDESAQRWPLSVYLCGLCLLVYLLGLVTIYSWVPNYAQTNLGMDQASAGNLVGRMFSGMFFGQLAMFVLVLKLPVRLLIFICLVAACYMTSTLWGGHSFATIETCMFTLGLVGGGILKVGISYGTTLTQSPSPKMVSYLLFNTALGTAIAPALSSWVVDSIGLESVIIFATACYGLSCALLLLTFLTAAPKKAAA